MRCLFLLLCVVGIFSANAAPPERIIFAGDSLPGGNGSVDFLTYPVISNGQTVFVAAGKSPETDRQIYGGLNSSSISLLAGLNIMIPSGTGTFTFVSDPAFYANRLVFGGLGDSGQSGIYSGEIGSYTRVADLTSFIPDGGSSTFASFDPSVLGLNAAGDVAFVGSGNTDTGIYRSNGGALSTVVTTAEMFPGSATTFEDLEGPALTGTSAYFFGSKTVGGVQGGIFGRNFGGGALETVAITGGQNPSGDAWTLFASPVAGGEAIAFVGETDNDLGVYRYLDETLITVVKTGQLIPGTTTEVAKIIPDLALNESGDVIMTVEDAASNRYLLSFVNEELGLLADINTLFDGQKPLEGVPSLGIGRYGFSGSEASIYVVTGTGQFGVYVVTVPEPGSLALLAAAGVGLIFLRRRFI